MFVAKRSYSALCPGLWLARASKRSDSDLRMSLSDLSAGGFSLMPIPLFNALSLCQSLAIRAILPRKSDSRMFSSSA